MRTSSAWLGGILIVIVVISVRPIVAVRPGSAPITSPASDDSATYSSDSGVANEASEWPNAIRPSNIAGLRQADEEDAFETQRHDEGRRDRNGHRERGAASGAARCFRRNAEHHDEREDEKGCRCREPHVTHETERVREGEGDRDE